MSGANRGYLTLATGRPEFLEMAVDMALSLREHTSLPVAVACDEPLQAMARERFTAAFDEVTLLPQRFRGGRIRKYGVAEATPFQETVFVDADCIVLGSLDPVFRSLDDTPMAMLGEQLTLENDENHHGFSTRALMKRFHLQRYLKTNSGIFCFRREPALSIMEACRTCFVEEAEPRLKWSILLGRWLGDEIAFGIVGGRLALGTLPPPAPMYWPQEFDGIDLDAPAKPLLHFIWPPSDPLLDRLLQGMRQRRSDAGVPGDAEATWRREVAKLKAMRRRRQWLERVGWW